MLNNAIFSVNNFEFICSGASCHSCRFPYVLNGNKAEPWRRCFDYIPWIRRIRYQHHRLDSTCQRAAAWAVHQQKGHRAVSQCVMMNLDAVLAWNLALMLWNFASKLWWEPKSYGKIMKICISTPLIYLSMIPKFWRTLTSGYWDIKLVKFDCPRLYPGNWAEECVPKPG
jgi:hypothetical protein